MGGEKKKFKNASYSLKDHSFQKGKNKVTFVWDTTVTAKPLKRIEVDFNAKTTNVVCQEGGTRNHWKISFIEDTGSNRDSTITNEIYFAINEVKNGHAEFLDILEKAQERKQ